AKAAKVVVAVRKTVEVVKDIKAGTQNSGIPEPIRDKLGVLEVLSLGYWGEKIGTAIGGGPDQIEIIDPEARAQLEAELANIDRQSHQLHQLIARNQDIADERELSGWALEQNRKEQARLENELHRMQAQAEQARQDAERYQQEQRRKQLKTHTERAVNQWLRSFDQQTAGMVELLRTLVKRHWEEQVTALVDERLRDIETLNREALASSEEKQATLARLREEAQGIQTALERLG
ncbi:MAG: hypothetical protein RIR17_1863, partial [Planctomycetota bacterium]